MYCNIISAGEVYPGGWTIFVPLAQQHVKALLDVATPKITRQQIKIQDVLFISKSLTGTHQNILFST